MTNDIFDPNYDTERLLTPKGDPVAIYLPEVVSNAKRAADGTIGAFDLANEDEDAVDEFVDFVFGGVLGGIFNSVVLTEEARGENGYFDQLARWFYSDDSFEVPVELSDDADMDLKWAAVRADVAEMVGGALDLMSLANAAVAHFTDNPVGTDVTDIAPRAVGAYLVGAFLGRAIVIHAAASTATGETGVPYHLLASLAPMFAQMAMSAMRVEDNEPDATVE